jgi:hypothetical protein
MKNNYFVAILFSLFVIGCEEDKIPELPDNISILKPVPDLVDSIKSYFPERKNTYLAYPDLFSHSYQNNIILKKESKVYVTFIDEGAGYRNVLCWYAYDKNLAAPMKASDVSGNVIFPNISKKGEGGQLESGYTVQVGTDVFPAGTVIGIFLVQDGWKDGTIDYGRPTFYTDYNLNTEARRQHILFKDSYFKYIIVGFEDVEFDNEESCDRDYNDIVFAVTDNIDGLEATAFDLAKVIIK